MNEPLHTSKKTDANTTAGKPGMIDRTFAILDCFTPDQPDLNLTQISARSGLPISTTSRILADLERHGAVERRNNGIYSIGSHLINLAQTARPMLGIQETASPSLDNLERITNLHVQLATLQGSGALIVDRRDGKQQLPIYYHIGDILPIVPTAVGRVLLAFASPSLQNAVLDHDNFIWPSWGTKRPSAQSVRETLKKVEREHIAFLDLKDIPVNSVAVPIFGQSKNVVAAVSVVVKTGTVPLAPKLADLLKGTAKEISRKLAGPKPGRVLPPWNADN
ncbi:IclR family transcriptional regulator [Bifidobacterium sp. ESL0732]|uniref:IclR family transcriptional regulator n=1 Tax=Bifidobacterium sp. ESL0732 TaxID=2983222 RepID=UPI0023F9BDAE|nr:IclR family transcriptional regulator [Bifidobacterium sp. ESL0732]WEV63616.1 IclR family transcriptional regulator [Bifidobacterium sp. ESL0732]